MRKSIFMLQIFTQLCFIVAAQNVGVGTSAPTEKLHVAGNIKADTIKPDAIKLASNAGAGKMLTSDASGNARWQELSANGSVGFGTWGDCSMNGVSEYNPVTDETIAAFATFGNSTSISGNFAIVGASNDDIEGNTDQGSASIFQFNGTNWVLMQKFFEENRPAFDYFGHSVCISGNYAIVGAPSSNFIGFANIYRFDGSNWVFMQKLTNPTTVAGDFFGASVSISGNFAVVGAPYDDSTFADQGSASIFQFNGTTWVLMQKISDVNSGAGDQFGYSVSISGNYAIIGANLDDIGINTNQGSVYFYQWHAGINWILMQKITDATGAASDFFGNNVSISAYYAIVGAYLDDTGAGTNTNEGSVSIYQRIGSDWTLMEKITDPTGAPNDNFGSSVNISGNYAIVGAYFDDVGTKLNQGSAHVYFRLGPGWLKLQSLLDPAGKQNDRFGYATAIDGNTQRFIIGADGYKDYWGKVVFGKVN